MKKTLIALSLMLVCNQPAMADTINYQSQDGTVYGFFNLDDNRGHGVEDFGLGNDFLTFEGGTLNSNEMRYEKSTIQDSFGIRVYANETTSSQFGVGDFFSLIFGNGSDDGMTKVYPTQGRTSTSWRGESSRTQGQITKVPEPSHLLLFALTLGGLVYLRRSRAPVRPS